jgi:hypothetical protein
MVKRLVRPVVATAALGGLAAALTASAYDIYRPLVLVSLLLVGSFAWTAWRAAARQSTTRRFIAAAVSALAAGFVVYPTVTDVRSRQNRVVPAATVSVACEQAKRTEPVGGRVEVFGFSDLPETTVVVQGGAVAELPRGQSVEIYRCTFVNDGPAVIHNIRVTFMGRFLRLEPTPAGFATGLPVSVPREHTYRIQVLRVGLENKHTVYLYSMSEKYLGWMFFPKTLPFSGPSANGVADLVVDAVTAGHGLHFTPMINAPPDRATKSDRLKVTVP